MRGIFHQDKNQNKNRREETETKKTRNKMRDGEMAGPERLLDRAPGLREGESEWRDGERRQAHGRGKHNRPLSTAERTQTEQVVEKGKKKGDTFPRERKGDRDPGRRVMEEEGKEMRQRDRPRRELMDYGEMERRRQERERVETQSRAIEERRRPPEDIRTQKRERYKVSGVEFQERTVEVDDSWDRRDRDAGRKKETFRTVMDMRESERYSPQKRPERELYTDRTERTPRRDARSEDVDVKELERRERIRDRGREDGISFTRNGEYFKSRMLQERDRVGYQERYREERYRDGRMEVRLAEREREGQREIGSHGRTDDDRYRNERRDRERKKRQEDGKAGRRNRSLSDSSPRVPPRGQSSEGDSGMRYRRDCERDQRQDGSVAKELQIDPGQAGEKSQRKLAKSERLDREELPSCGSDKSQMWLEPHRGKTQPRQKEGRRVDKWDIKLQAEGERDALRLQGDLDESNITQSRERQLERREQCEDSEGLSVDGEEDDKTFIEGKEQLSDSGGSLGEERSRRRDLQGEDLLNNTRESGTEEEGSSDSGGGGGSDSIWYPDRDKMLFTEDSNVILSSGRDDADDMEQNCRKREKFCKPWILNKKEELIERNEEVINPEQQGRENKFIFCVVGQTSSRSETNEVSLSQDEENGRLETDDPNIENHHRSSDEDTSNPQHDLMQTPSRRDEQLFLDSQGTGNGYSTPRGEDFTSGNPNEGDFGYGAPVDLQDKEVEEIMEKEPLPNDLGAKKRDSQTERLLKQWRENNKRKGDQTSGIPTNSCADLPPRSSSEQIQPFLDEINTEAMSPEEVEAIRIRKSGTWSDSKVTKWRSKAPHLKWATTVVREILGHSGEQTEDEPNSELEENQGAMQAENNRHQEEAERKVVNLPVVTLTTDDQQSEPEQEEEEEDYDLDYKDDNDIRSKSWGEVDLKNVLNSLGRRSRKSSIYNRPQLYQQYNEEKQNFEILRQSRSDNLSVCEVNSRSPLPSPQPARRPLPPLPSVPHPHSLSLSGSVNCAQTLPLPEQPKSERRASSPSLSLSLTQSSLLWRDLPAVRNSPKLEKLTEDQRRLQEVRFEVVTSEASYSRSLDIVVEHFVKCKELETLLTTQDKNWLFSRLTEVRVISYRFLAKLEERVESDVTHFTVCDIIAQQCQRFKKVYVPYLTNQSYQDATYQRLMNDNPNFKRIVDSLEKSSVCQRLPLRSFLVLPFQRITRIKLLVQNILKRTTPGTVEAENTIKALRRLEKIIQESNDSIAEMKTIESLVSLSGKVEFVECKTLPLISQKRRLVREGPVTELMDFSLKQTERTIYLHLFNDHLLVSLQKEGGRFTVIDHCPVNELRTEDFRVKLLTLQKNSFRLHMSQRSLLLRTETQSDKQRWLSALSRTHPVVDFSTAEKKAQMQCIRAYVAQQPDELSVEKADVILVHQDSADNWVEGTRLSDLHCGWVPKSHLKVISNDIIKKRNLSDALTLTKATAAF
ncbi:zinc finger CCCH domain-containing protein 13 isoform X2 [Girardinichthys multiradiatus]|nr:zinc finger CCCH domain-containing protein 13 isoform X2 [Girardinichthys multiradiatus]